MSDGFLQRFPNPAELERVGGDAEVAVSVLLDRIGGMGHDSEGSPLAGVAGAFGELGGKLDVDVSGLTERLPEVLDTVRQALPPSALEYVEAIDGAYSLARDALESGPLARALSHGGSLQEVALEVVSEALEAFDRQVESLAEQLIDPDTLSEVRAGLDGFARFAEDYDAHRDDLLPFLARNLVGVAEDVLDAPLARVKEAVAVLAPIEPDALAGTVDAALEASAGALTGLRDALDGLDPADHAAYVEIEARLDALGDAVAAMEDAVGARYGAFADAIEAHPWGGLMSTYAALLGAIDIGRVPTVADGVDAVVAVLDDLTRRLVMVLDGDELAGQVDVLVQAVDDTLATSGVRAARGTLEDALGEIRDAIASVPTEEIQKTVDEMLAQVGEQLHAIDAAKITKEIEDALGEASTFITDTFKSSVVDEAKAAVGELLTAVQSLPLDDLTSRLAAALKQASDLVGEIEAAVQAQFDELKALLAQLDGISFKPVSDEVIAEIEEVEKRLKAMNPASLSAPERLALSAALTVLEAIDLEGAIIQGLEAGFEEARKPVADLLAQLERALERVTEHLDALDPVKLLGPIHELVQKLERAADSVNATVLLKPLHGLLDELTAQLEHLAPHTLLEPLAKPYAAAMGALERLDPKQWVAPLDDLYAEIDRLIGRVDVTPLLDELDKRRRALLDSIRTAILDALDALDLPAPIDTLLAQMRPVLESFAGALFDEPGQVATLPAGVDLTTPMKALDAPFDELLAMAAAVPEADLTAAVEALRRGLGSGLDVLDPRAVVERLRQGQAWLAALDPTRVLGPALTVPALRASFEVRVEAAPAARSADIASARASFEATFALVDPGRADTATGRLLATHRRLTGALGEQIEALDPAEAIEAYGHLRADLDRLVPAFLRRTDPLSHADVMAGLAGLRPSLAAAPVEEAVQRFLAQLQPLESSVADAVDRLLGVARTTLALVDPLSLKHGVEAIYDTVRAKVRIIDPAALADAVEALLGKLKAPLEALDPAKLGAQLDAAYKTTVDALTKQVDGLLGDIGAAIDEQLRAIRAAVKQAVGDVEAFLKQVAGTVHGVIEKAEQLVIVELVGRLQRLVDNLAKSFHDELERVRNAFDAMLKAIPLDGGGAAGAIAA